MEHIAREDAYTLLKKYNQDPFHIQHAFTVEAVMKWYAQKLGYGEEAELVYHCGASTDGGSCHEMVCKGTGLRR